MSQQEDHKPDTAQLISSMCMRRDPSKRVIKPTNADFSLYEDLEDDSDSEYVCEEEDDDSEGGGIKDDSDGGSDSSDKETASSSEDDSTKQSDDVKEILIDENSVECSQASVTNVEECKTFDQLPAEAPRRPNAAKMHVKVCMLCLGDRNDQVDELIECDRCGVIVHEDCHKVANGIFVSTMDSSSNTDPWFCEPCLAGAVDPVCELCPNSCGVFKRTDNNRWVHLLCALYTPGVAFNYPDALMEVTLTELPNKEWSAHECCVCEIKFFAWTGICICCDAGLCKNYFHVTCAHKHGLLAEPAFEENPTDPFFAQCSQHTDKIVMKIRKRNYLIAMRQAKVYDASQSGKMNDDHLTDRMRRKLQDARIRYWEFIAAREKPFTLTQKSALFLENSPSAMRLFVKKALALNLPHELVQKGASHDGQHKHSGYPVFSPEFVVYFLEREKKLAENAEKLKSLSALHSRLETSSKERSASYEASVARLAELKQRAKNQRLLVKEAMDALHKVFPSLSVPPSMEVILTRLSEDARPDAAQQQKLKDGPPTANGRPAISYARQASRTARLNAAKASDSTDVAPTPAASTVARFSKSMHGEVVILECSVCKLVHDQHLITACDICNEAFHLACLDPPLTRLPKRSKMYGWQCCFCTKKQTCKSDLGPIDLDAPRKLRTTAGMKSRLAPGESPSPEKRPRTSRPSQRPRRAATEAVSPMLDEGEDTNDSLGEEGKQLRGQRKKMVIALDSAEPMFEIGQKRKPVRIKSMSKKAKEATPAPEVTNSTNTATEDDPYAMID